MSVWPNRDPIGEKEGGANLYAFAINDPTDILDVLGLKTITFKVGRDIGAPEVDRTSIQAQLDQLLKIAGKCYACATPEKLSATFSVDNAHQAAPLGVSDWDGKSIRTWSLTTSLSADERLLRRSGQSIKGSGIPILLTVFGIRWNEAGSKPTDARAAAPPGVAVLLNVGYLKDLGILAHELGHYAGYQGHSADRGNIMYEDAPTDGYPDQAWCKVVLPLFK